MTVLFVLFTLVVFLTADFMVQKFRAHKAGVVIRERVSSMVDALKQVPADVQLALNHMWVKQDAGSMVTVGVDEFIAKFFGVVDRILVPETGAEAGTILLQSGERSIAIACPVQGRVVAVNPAIMRNAGAAYDDPYGAGWLMQVQPAGKISRSSLVSGQPQQWLKEQVSLAREFFLQKQNNGSLALMQDGGAIVDGVMRYYDAEVWEQFNEKFLSTRG